MPHYHSRCRFGYGALPLRPHPVPRRNVGVCHGNTFGAQVDRTILLGVWLLLPVTALTADCGFVRASWDLNCGSNALM